VAPDVKSKICFTALIIVFCKPTGDSNSAEDYSKPSPIVTGVVVVANPKAVISAIRVVVAASCYFPTAVTWATVAVKAVG